VGTWAGLAVISAIVGCGGESLNSTGRGGSGGNAEGGPGGSGNARGSGGASGGKGGATGGFGGVCACPAIACGRGYQSVHVQGQCCPQCVSCGAVDCANPGCPPGEIPVVLRGQCCPSSCGPSGIGGSGGTGGSAGSPGITLPEGGVCERANPPKCGHNAPPYCAPDWATAKAWFVSCDGGLEFGLGTCGPYDVLVVWAVYAGVYTTDRYFYNSQGNLVGHLDFSGARIVCDAYDSTFDIAAASCTVVGTSCQPFTSP
jgi:hypothetical protein